MRPSIVSAKVQVLMTLLPYQRVWLADTSQVKVYEKSRRIGGSRAEAGDDALYAASWAGQDVQHIGYYKDMARQFIDDGAFWARHYQLAAAAMEEDVFAGKGLEGRDILVYRIRFASGHEIVALSSRPTELRGKQEPVSPVGSARTPPPESLLFDARAYLINRLATSSASTT
jgi:phage FluMu gp28-like protein